MARLEDLTRGASVKGILPDRLVTVVDIRWHGSAVVELTYKDVSGRLGNELLYSDSEPTVEVVEAGRPWSFDGDGAVVLSQSLLSWMTLGDSSRRWRPSPRLRCFNPCCPG